MSGAPEFRRDAFTGDHSVVAERRRAMTRGKSTGGGLPNPPGPCPFCPGNEAETERTVMRAPPAESGDPWAVRIVPNLYPWVSEAPESAFDWRAPDEQDVVFGAGVHDVVIEHPDHDITFADYDPDHLMTLLRVLRARVGQHESLGPAAVSLFRNRGRRAGSSQPHPHMQIISAPVLGPGQRARWACATEHFEAHQTRLLAHIMDVERRAEERVVADADGLLAWSPYSPRNNYQLNVAAQTHAGSFANAADETLEAMARHLPRFVRAALDGSRRTDFNLIFHLPPVAQRAHPAAFWWLEIAPRGGGGAGFELSSGLHMLAHSPERTAREMRDALPA